MSFQTPTISRIRGSWGINSISEKFRINHSVKDTIYSNDAFISKIQCKTF
jgi:hypothetical protein